MQLRIAKPYLIAILTNLLAHFVPFERGTRSLDDAAQLSAILRLDPTHMSIFKYVLHEVMSSPNRPFEIYVALLQLVAGFHQWRIAAILFLTSSALTCAVYVLLRQLVGHAPTALAGTLLFIVLPNKSELYHTLDHANQNTVYTIYLISCSAFITFATSARARWLWMSLGAYTVAIFWYELGYALPMVLADYAYLFKRQSLRSVSWFLVPMLGYAAWRTGTFGLLPWSVPESSIRWRSVIVNLCWMFPQHYVGRFMAKPIAYGLYRFPTLEMPWLAVVLAADAIGLLVFWRWIRVTAFPPLRTKMRVFAIVLSLALVLPATAYWAVLSRHTALASIGIVLLLVAALGILPARQRAIIFTGLVSVFLLACQGMAWNQVVAGRLQQAIFQTLQNRREEIRVAKRVLIDQYSFAERIPYTWVHDPNNQLDTYWGATALPGPAFQFLFDLVTEEGIPLYVVRSPIQIRDGELAFQDYVSASQLRDVHVPARDTVIIDYRAVYGTTEFPWR